MRGRSLNARAHLPQPFDLPRQPGNISSRHAVLYVTANQLDLGNVPSNDSLSDSRGERRLV